MAGEVTQAKLEALKTGITAALTKIQELLDAEAYAETLPIIGNQLAGNTTVANSINSLRSILTTAVQEMTQVSNLASLTPQDVANMLNSKIVNALGGLSQYGFTGTPTTTADNNGNISIFIDSGRIVTLPFSAASLGMSGLGLTLGGGGSATLSYDIDFKVGVDGTGFYLDPTVSKVNLGIGAGLNDLSANAKLGFLNFTVQNVNDSDPTPSADTLKLDLVTTWNTGALIRSFNSDFLNVTATGDVDLDLHLAADMQSAALPSINTDLKLDWHFNQNILNGTSANSWGDPTLTFQNINYSFGSFVETYITPILDKLDGILGPINTALAIFRTDISGILLPEWAALLDVVPDGIPNHHKVTLLDFLQLASNAANRNIDLAPLVQG
ncbi:MAG: hypothetical protein V4537_15270 [Pseudomonadota bacterium]